MSIRHVWTFAGLSAFLLAVPLAAPKPDAAQILSPPQMVTCKFADGQTVGVHYSSPRMRGRRIFGELVPYGEVWRAGADEATTFVPSVNVTVGGTSVPAGKYTLFTLPNRTEWKLIISRQTGEWGIPYPGAQYDFARVPMKLSKLSKPLENFTISFEEKGSACAMNLDWETTRASIDIVEKK